MDTEGRRIRGYIIELSTAAVSLTDGRVTWTMTDAEVGRIERADPLTNGMWIGAGLTFAATMAYCKLVEEPRTGLMLRDQLTLGQFPSVSALV